MHSRAPFFEAVHRFRKWICNEGAEAAARLGHFGSCPKSRPSLHQKELSERAMSRHLLLRKRGWKPQDATIAHAGLVFRCQDFNSAWPVGT